MERKLSPGVTLVAYHDTPHGIAVSGNNKRLGVVEGSAVEDTTTSKDATKNEQVAIEKAKSTAKAKFKTKPKRLFPKGKLLAV